MQPNRLLLALGLGGALWVAGAFSLGGTGALLLLAGPLVGGEGILYADLDLGQGTWAQLVNRQYDRPDLLRLAVAGAPESGAAAVLSSDDDASLRRLIADRFGDRLSAADVDELVPYARGIRAAGERLAALGLEDADPRTAGYAEDQRQLE